MCAISNVLPLSAEVIEKLNDSGIDYWFDKQNLVTLTKEDLEVAREIIYG